MQCTHYTIYRSIAILITLAPVLFPIINIYDGHAQVAQTYAGRHVFMVLPVGDCPPE